MGKHFVTYRHVCKPCYISWWILQSIYYDLLDRSIASCRIIAQLLCDLQTFCTLCKCKSNFNRNEVLLLLIENIKTNQKGKFCQGDKNAQTFFLYHFTTCVPCVPQSNRNILSITNTDTSQMSLFNHSKTVRVRNLIFWENYHHTLCVMWFFCLGAFSKI